MPTHSPTLASQKSRQLGLLLLALAAILASFAATAPGSKASPVSLTFDNGRISMGFFQDRTVLPADSSFPSPDLPTPQRTDIQLNGDLTDGNISIPAATNTGIQFPYMNVKHPLQPDLKIPFTFRLNQDGLTGTFNQETGAMTLEGNLDIIVITGTGTNFPLTDSLDDVGVPPLGLFARCRYDNVPVKLSTAKSDPFNGQPFADGFGTNGALAASWKSLTPSVSENGGTCGDLNQLTTSIGGLWLSNAVAEPKPQPEGPKPSCKTDLSLCPEQKYTLIDGVQLKPGRKTVKPGQTVTLTVKVHNSGNKTARNLKVKVKSTNKSFKVPKKVTLTVPAGRSAKRKFKVRIKGNAKGWGRITAVNNGWPGHTYLKVRP